jgi:D-3-phosphoglycerate dehydrogenase
MEQFPPLVYLGPSSDPGVAEAIRRGGGRVTADAGEATAIVWVGGAVEMLQDLVGSHIEWLQLPSAGVEGYVRLGVVTATHVTTCAGPAYARNVAEHALALLLSCARRIPGFSRANRWSTVQVDRLAGSSVAIVGCGRIGRSLIGLLRPFEVRIHVSTRSGEAVEGAITTVTGRRLSEILPGADYVVVAAPATPQTAGLIGRAQFAAMRPTAYLINVARGSLVDTAALVDAISSGTIAGAALDVTDPEPLPDDHPLWRLDQVLITPHVANPEAWDMAEYAPLVEENVRRFCVGDPLLGIVSPERGY